MAGVLEAADSARQVSIKTDVQILFPKKPWLDPFATKGKETEIARRIIHRGL